MTSLRKIFVLLVVLKTLALAHAWNELKAMSQTQTESSAMSCVQR